MGVNVLTRDLPMDGIGASRPPIFWKSQFRKKKSWSKVSQTAKGLATTFSVTFSLVKH